MKKNMLNHIKPRRRMIKISSSANAAKLAIITILGSFISLHEKKECPRKVMREKGSLSVCLSVCRLTVSEKS